MGSINALTIADYPLYETKGAPSQEMGALFTPDEFFHRRRSIRKRNSLIWGEVTERGTETVYEYRSTASKVRRRLELIGFTMEAYEATYRAMHREQLEISRSIEIDYPLRGLSPKRAAQLAVDIIEKRALPWRANSVENLDARQRYMLTSDEYMLGLTVSDARYAIRAMVEYLPPDAEIVFDLTDQVRAGYYGLGFAQTVGQPGVERIVVLTEGRTDTEVLSESMSLLYPELASYFQWPDLSIRLMGGTSGLTHTLRALLSVGVSRPIVALFDNDTEGHRALQSLRKDGLPNNVRAACYPHLRNASAWPCEFPDGIRDADLNGRACSLELYLGSDVLHGDGQRNLVQWVQDKGSGAWQGTIRDKDGLKEKFRDKLRRSQLAGQPIGDWSGIQLLLSILLEPYSKEFGR
jgi:hypothetical protein